MPRLAPIAVAALAACATLAAAGAASPAPTPGAVQVAAAAELAESWDRCATARPAAETLATAQRLQRSSARPPVKLRSARAALGAWRQVVRDCSQPIAMPSVTR